MDRLLIAFLISAGIVPLAAEPLTVASPDGRLKLVLEQNAEHHLSYSFQADGRALINPSPLGFATKGESTADRPATTSRRSVDTVWKPVWGKRAVVPERFNELTLDLTRYR